jgi:hypothetical protein
MVDGKPAEGEFLMADGSTINWKGIVTQILVMEWIEPVVDATSWWSNWRCSTESTDVTPEEKRCNDDWCNNNSWIKTK